jgi:hypothetical protein
MFVSRCVGTCANRQQDLIAADQYFANDNVEHYSHASGWMALSREGNGDHPGQAALIDDPAEGKGPCHSQRPQIARLQEVPMKRRGSPKSRLEAIYRDSRNRTTGVIGCKQALTARLAERTS